LKCDTICVFIVRSLLDYKEKKKDICCTHSIIYMNLQEIVQSQKSLYTESFY